MPAHPDGIKTAAPDQHVKEAQVLSKRYTIIVEGGLGQRFAGAFPTASLVAEDGKTRLDTEPLDQSQLHGLLERLRSFAIELVSVHEVVEPQRDHGHIAGGLPEADPGAATERRDGRAEPPRGARR